MLKNCFNIIYKATAHDVNFWHSALFFSIIPLFVDPNAWLVAYSDADNPDAATDWYWVNDCILISSLTSNRFGYRSWLILGQWLYSD